VYFVLVSMSYSQLYSNSQIAMYMLDKPALLL
jgi:hypothetical protein